MASDLDFVTYICEAASLAGDITYKKMFGEYGIYCDGKFFGCVCDNQFFIKITKAGQEILSENATGSPYPGAKPWFIYADCDNRELLKTLIQKTCAELPVPKPKSKPKPQAKTNLKKKQ
jgi:TfoX/Sxy family transcriptional regulator of competence genes